MIRLVTLLSIPLMFGSALNPVLHIHSTFRGPTGRVVRPDGLEYDMEGTSQVRFAISEGQKALLTHDYESSVVETYNRWAASKDLPFKTADDILTITEQGERHLHVEWQEDDHIFEEVILNDSAEDLLRQDRAATDGGGAAQVWVNGNFVGILDDPDSLDAILPKIPSSNNKFCYKRYPGRIHLDRYYVSYLRYNHAWDHVWDNLVALEDVQIVDDNTLLGTATLKDWIMGGQLTSRLWVRDQSESILFMRPLFEDNIDTADRRYEVNDPVKLEAIRKELKRLRYLTTLKHPYVVELLQKKEQARNCQKERKAG